MRNQQIMERLIEDFGRHCNAQQSYDLGKLLGQLRFLVATGKPGDDNALENIVALQLEQKILKATKSGWEKHDFLSDAITGFCDHFTPSINLVYQLNGQSEALDERLITAHCQTIRPLGHYQTYAPLLNALRNNACLGERLITHMMGAGQREIAYKAHFPLQYVLVEAACYEYRDCLRKNELEILAYGDQSNAGFNASKVASVRKLWELNLKGMARAVLTGSFLLPHGDDLVWLRENMGFTPSPKWQERCWHSETDAVVEAIVRYFLTFEDADFPADAHVCAPSLCKALKRYNDNCDVHTSERYTQLLDHLVANTPDGAAPIYDKLPRLALEQSSLYMERQLQNDLGL